MIDGSENGPRTIEIGNWSGKAIYSPSYYVFPLEHWRLLRTNNPLERINREIRRRTRVVGNFPDGQSALMLVAARLRHIASTKWGTRAYMDMEHLYSMERDQEEKALELPMSV